MLLNAYKRSLLSIPSAMFLECEATSMISAPPTLCRLPIFTTVYVSSASFVCHHMLRVLSESCRVCLSTSIATSSGSTRKPFKKNAVTKVLNRTGTGPYHGKTHGTLLSSMALQPPWAATVDRFLTALQTSLRLASISQLPQPPEAAASTRVLSRITL